MRMRDKVVVSQDGAEKIEGYFRQVIFELVRVFDRESGYEWNLEQMFKVDAKISRLTKNVDLYYIHRVGLRLFVKGYVWEKKLLQKISLH